MIAPSAPLQLVARAGEEIVCPECRLPVALILGDCYGADSAHWPFESTPMDRGDGDCMCGGGPCTTADLVAPRHMRHAPAHGAHLMLFIRSGKWTGWRSLGGE